MEDVFKPAGLKFKTAGLGQWMKVEMSGDPAQICQEAMASGEAVTCQPNYLIQADSLPDDLYVDPDQDGTWSSGAWGQDFEDLWGLKMIRAVQAWNARACRDNCMGEGVVVAVVDTGLNVLHPDIQGNVHVNSAEIPNDAIDNDHNGYVDDVSGYDFTTCAEFQNGLCVSAKERGPDVWDGHGHGSHVSGTIAAVADNGIGVAGVAPKAKILPIKGLNNSGMGTSADLAAGIVYASVMGARVINNSWGCGVPCPSHPIVEDAVREAFGRGAIVIFSAGNADDDTVNYSPQNMDGEVWTIAAVDHLERKSVFSNYGHLIDVAAPGGGDGPPPTNRPERNILSLRAGLFFFDTAVGDWYLRLAGTSMAAPHAAGVAALMLSKNPNLSNAAAAHVIQVSSDDLGAPGKDSIFGYGRLDAYQAVLGADQSVSIDYPAGKSYVQGMVEVRGSAFFSDGFESYQLSAAPESAPDQITVIHSSSIPVDHGWVGKWHTRQYSDGPYALILKVRTTHGDEIADRVLVTIDNLNQPPVIPLKNKAAVIGRRLEFQVPVEDPDDPSTGWGTVSVSADHLPPGAQWDPVTRIFSWHPLEGDQGTYSVSFQARDSKRTTVQEVVLNTVKIVETRVTTVPAFHNFPAVYGDRIVWEDFRLADYDDPHADPDIYLFDASTGLETRVGFGPPYSYQYFPDLDEGKIVWEDHRDRESSIYVYDLSTGLPKRVTQSDVFLRQPHIDQNNVVYTDRNFNVYLLDLETEWIKHIGNTRIGNDSAISGDRIMWSQKESDGSSQPHLYDLSTGQETRLDFKSSQPLGVDLDGDQAIWSTGIIGRLYRRDLSTGETIRLSDYNFNGESAIDSGKIIWTDYRNWASGTNNTDIYLYDLERDQELQITSDPYQQIRGVISRNRVVWIDQRHVDPFTDEQYPNNDVYMAELIYSPHVLGITPMRLHWGETVEIRGRDFGDTQAGSMVKFAPGLEAEIQTWAESRIVAKVPKGAVTGASYVVTAGGMSNAVMVRVRRSRAAR